MNITGHYEATGVQLVGSVERDYAPNAAVTVTLLRCTECDALAEQEWQGGNEVHTEWHRKLARLLALLPVSDSTED